MDPQKVRMLVGLAHSALGYALVRQDKFLPAIPELKAASADVKEDPSAYGTVSYRLGFAYVKAGKLVEAKAALTEAVAVAGPYQASARELLGKVDAAMKGKK